MRVSIDPEGTEIGAINEMVDLSGKTVLEVGCGDGRLTWRYAEQAASVLALDPNEEKIKQAIENTPETLRSKVSFQVADITVADLPPEAFDVAILAHSLCCIQLEGLGHALERIHHALRADGELMDVHPQPEQTRAEIWQEGRVEPLGPLDEEEDIRAVLQARARLNLIEQRGWFVTERRRVFEMLDHYPSVEDWLEQRAREGATSIIPEGMIDSARHLLTTGGGELIRREPVRASLLRRLPGDRCEDLRTEATDPLNTTITG